MGKSRRSAVSLLMILITAVLIGVVEARTVTVAVVRDGPSADDSLVPLIEEELLRLVGVGIEVRFKQTPEFDAGWEGSRIRGVVENALGDRGVDIVLGIGGLVTQEAAREDLILTKPFVSTFVQRADIPQLPYSEEGVILKENLSLIVIPERAERDVVAFQRLVPFSRLHVAVDAAEEAHFSRLRSILADYGERLGFAIVAVPVTDNVQEPLSSLGPDVEAVYLTRMPRLTAESRRAFIDALTGRGIPTFSMVGHSDVELGALAALTPDVTRQVVRRSALNLSNLIRGVPSDELPVFLTVDTKIWINGRTAAAVGYWPDFEAQIYARFLHKDALEAGAQPLTLEQAFRKAEAGNVSLSIKDSGVESAYRDKQRALSSMLPQIIGDAAYQTQEPIMESSLLPEDLTLAGLRVSQMLFDDRVISNYRSSSRLHESKELDREIERLDVLGNTGRSYLELALTTVLLSVQADNVRLTEDNLDVAKVRYDVGRSGKDEVFRWEAELAQRRSDMLRTYSLVEAERIALNQVLGVDQDLRWTPEKFEVDPAVFTFIGTQVGELLGTPDRFARFRAFMIGLAEANSPELQFLDKLIEAQEIQIGQRKRRFLLPSFVANFTYDYYLDRTPEIPEGRDDTYRLELAAVYPLFEGGNRYQDLKRQQSELDGLKKERELARQRVEQRTRTALRRIESSFRSIGLSVSAATNSRLNLEVVQDKYAQGIVNITDLLEAQNQSFAADQNEAAAVYTFLLDVVEVQRAISWFQHEHSEEERDGLARQIRESIELD